MKAAIANMQRYVFVIFLYVSALYTPILDQLGLMNRTGIYIVFDCIIYFLAFFSLSTIPKGFRSIIALILIGIFLNFTYSPAPLSVSLNGIREVLAILAVPIFYYKIFAEGNEQEAMRYIRIMKKFTWFFLLIQIVPVMIQFKQFGPTDYVGGSYGWLNTGNLTTIIVCMIFFLFQFPNSPWKKLLLFLLLYPLMLNETKISYILIPMMVMFLFFEPKIKNIVLAGVGAVLFFLIFNQLYTNDAANMGKNFSEIFNPDFLDEYLLSDPISHPDVPRFTKLIMGYKLISEQASTFFFGLEFGMFRGTGTGEVTRFAQNYAWLLSGTRPYIFILMMQGGIVLVTGFFLAMLYICRFFRYASKHVLFYFIIILVVMTYAESFRNHNFLIVFMFYLFFVNSEIFKTKAYLNEDFDSLY
jgi:hypothetical protein